MSHFMAARQQVEQNLPDSGKRIALRESRKEETTKLTRYVIERGYRAAASRCCRGNDLPAKRAAARPPLVCV
jgi:hypothetical protein